MSEQDPPEIAALREALSFSPENVALRKHLADTLLKYGRFAAAETELKEALRLDRDNPELKIGLARACHEQDRDTEAFVILEALQQNNQLSPQGTLLLVRLLSRTTELVKAAELYKELLGTNPQLRDEHLDEELAPFLFEEDDLDQRIRVGDQRQQPEIEFEKPKISFEHVGGMEDVKAQIRMKIIHPLTHAEMFKAYGKQVGGGILLYGPPGCGKTLMARATAGEVKARFISVGLHDVLDMWVGASEKNLHTIFNEARRANPTVLFFDEVDALGASRNDMKQSGSRTTINQFLSELDGVDSSNDGLLILAATNAPWHLDSAFRRPGRFDRIIFIPPPDFEARVAIFKVMLQDKPIESIDFEALAKKTDNFSGADLKAVVDRTIEAKLDEAMRDGKLVPMRTKDLLHSIKAVRPSTKEWFATAKNYALYANQSGLYDEILDYLKIKR